MNNKYKQKNICHFSKVFTQFIVNCLSFGYVQDILW